jgi:F0F1-type ATP synthase membrane subunit b/b'
MDPLQINVTRMGGSVNIDIDLTVFIQLGLFLVLMLILNKLVFQPFLRRNELREALAAARADAAADRQALRTDGLSNKDTQVSAAREAAASTLAAAQAKASSQFDEARQALLADVDALSKQVAGKVLGRGV